MKDYAFASPMKRQNIISALLTLAIALPSPLLAQCYGEGCAPYYPPYQPPINRPPVGFFDFANTSGIYGWACDPDTPATPVMVHFYVGGPAGQGTLVGAATADVAREPAVAQNCGGYSNRGFVFQIPFDRAYQTFDVYAYAIDTTDATQHTNLGSRRYTPPVAAYPAFYPTYYPYYPAYDIAVQPKIRRSRRSRRARRQTYTYPVYTYPTTTLDDSRHFEPGDTRWCGSQLQYCGGTNAF